MSQQFIAYYHQDRNGRGLRTQQALARRVLRYYHDIGATVAASYADTDCQGRRPQLTRAIRAARRSGAVLLVARLGNLRGDVGFLLELHRSGLDVVFADAPGAGRWTVGAMIAVARRKAAGAASNGRDAMPVLVDLLHESGSPQNVAEALHARGFKAPRGARWNDARVLQALRKARADADRVLA